MSLRHNGFSIRGFAMLMGLTLSAGAAMAQDQDGKELEATEEAPPAVLPQQMYGPYQMYGAIPPLYYNYYYPGQPNGQIPARLYLSPIPVPEYVGYTYITYNPFAPQELMHVHARQYGRYHANGGQTTTNIAWTYRDHRPHAIRCFHHWHHWLNTR